MAEQKYRVKVCYDSNEIEIADADALIAEAAKCQEDHAGLLCSDGTRDVIFEGYDPVLTLQLAERIQDECTGQVPGLSVVVEIIK